jgi:hypothetical protein
MSRQIYNIDILGVGVQRCMASRTLDTRNRDALERVSPRSWCVVTWTEAKGGARDHSSLVSISRPKSLKEGDLGDVKSGHMKSRCAFWVGMQSQPVVM